MSDLDRAFVTTLEHVVDLYGENYKYPVEKGCVYFIDSCPSCLIGQVLHRLGFTAKVLGEFYGSINEINTQRADVVMMPLKFFSKDLVDAARCAQIIQDRIGSTWGEALQAFHDHLESVGKIEEYGVTPR